MQRGNSLSSQSKEGKDAVRLLNNTGGGGAVHSQKIKGWKSSSTTIPTLHIEYAERGNEHGILVKFCTFSECTRLEYVRVHVIYRVNQAEYVIHVRVVALYGLREYPFNT